jgi:hypothetical protein
MARILPCPCKKEPLTTIGEATAYGIFVETAMAEAQREAGLLAEEGNHEAAANISCKTGCNPQVKHLEPKIISKDSTRLWWTLFLAVECQVQVEVTWLYDCVEGPPPELGIPRPK